MRNELHAFAPPYARVEQAAAQSRFMASIYRWMAAGLALTAVVAMYAASTPALAEIVYQPGVFFGLIIAELVMVFAFNPLARRASAPVMMALFLSYAAMNGLTLSVIFLSYRIDSIANVFFTTTGMFAAMSIYASVTKRDLSGVGSFCFMGLIGVLIAGVVNMFVHSNALAFILSCAGVLVFVGLTAYDTQKLRALATVGGSEERSKMALRGALILYLDFVNLFLYLLRLMGRRR